MPDSSLAIPESCHCFPSTVPEVNAVGFSQSMSVVVDM